MSIKVCFRIIRKRANKNREEIICTEFFPLDQICHQGECEFLHTFGPGFINFYSSGNVSRSDSIWKKKKFYKTCVGLYPGNR